ncbi:hypothetical protein ACFRKE_03475 [Kitasatospora indigofera]|uniref:hypothetical protein n=1 Tax=Kitasatospora indigofera TaxID=67307 RepID=UPI0036C7B177
MILANLEASNDLPPDVAILVVDIVGYSKVPETAMPALREALDGALAETFGRVGLAADWAELNRGRDTGDGWIRIVPASKVTRLVDPGIAFLEEALHRYDGRRRASDPVLRTRLSVHLGPLSIDYRGDAINDACRLVDSEAVRSAATAAASHNSFTASIISDEVHRRVVAAGRTSFLAERDFLEVSANVPNKQFSKTAWVHVPRLSPEILKANSGLAGPSPAALPQASTGPQLNFAGNVGTSIGTVGSVTMGDINFA